MTGNTIATGIHDSSLYENIPAELKELRQWCGYRLEPRGEKMTKIPVNAYTGEYAKSNDRSTWADYTSALSAVYKFGLDGIGFFFAPPYFGIDIDAIEADLSDFSAGGVENIAAEFIHSLQSYTERSRSKKGIHIICRGELPAGGRRKGNIEMYQNGRFFVMTGDIAAEYTEINDCTESVKYLHGKYIGGSDAPSLSSTAQGAGTAFDAGTIVDIALKSKQGTQFRTLYEGRWQGLYPSQSEADIAFCNMLAFWAGRDAAKMDEIFRSCALMREKWDRKTGELTYGQKTILRAVQDCTAVFVPGNGIEDFELKIKSPQSSEPREKYGYDDTGNAERFVRQFGDIVRYSYTNKNWLYYTGEKWQYDQTGVMKALADRVIHEMKKEFAYIYDEDEEKALLKHIKATRNNKGKINMLKEAEHKVPILPHEMDAHPYLLNCKNGYIDLQTGNLYEHKKELLFTKQTGIEFTDKIDCPLWISFLNEIFLSDQALIRFVQKAIGYSLTGSNEQQCMFLGYGSGLNGKTVLMDLITLILGDYAMNTQAQTLMVRQISSGTANPDIARLKGARFVTTTESNEGVRFDEGLIKQLTGGDKVTARFLYKDEFEYVPEFKIWLATNHKPIIRGRDEGIWRRMHLIPFLAKIPKEKIDRNLKYKLRAELTGILAWAVEGALLWQAEGLDPPEAVRNATLEYRHEMDVIALFLDECCETGPGFQVSTGDLYSAYKDWARENNQYAMSSTKFGREVSERFEKRSSCGKRFYLGVKLMKNYQPYSANYNF